MSRVDQGLVRKSQKLIAQRIVEMAAEILCRPAERGAQIGSADIADEERVSGQDGIRFICDFFYPSKIRIEIDSIV